MVESARLLFSHREAVLVTGVSEEALHSWVRRDYVVPAVASTGRGKRRAYDQMNLVQIQVLQNFAQAGIDPSLASLVFDRLKPLAEELIARFASEKLPSWSAQVDKAATSDREYRTWLIDRLGMVCAEFTSSIDGMLVPDRPLSHIPLTAMWLKVDVLLNEWVLFPIEYVQAGRPQSEEDFEIWLEHRVTEAAK